MASSITFYQVLESLENTEHKESIVFVVNIFILYTQLVNICQKHCVVGWPLLSVMKSPATSSGVFLEHFRSEIGDRYLVIGLKQGNEAEK